MMWLTGSNADFTDMSTDYTDAQRNGFSLIELMITMVILCVGLVLVIQGFITAAGALNTAQNHITAVQFLEEKMQQLEALEKKDGGVTVQDSEGEFYSAAREFKWSLEISDIKNIEDLELDKELNEVKLKSLWQERNQPNELSLATYLKNKKE